MAVVFEMLMIIPFQKFAQAAGKSRPSYAKWLSSNAPVRPAAAWELVLYPQQRRCQQKRIYLNTCYILNINT